ncbi:c-type cytochrome [Rhodobacter capsulatus]|uniref:c-type cytochrome n=1 Tax=Rhodobacter capsulatus TaxID=1061 RepID=UPI0040273047
MQFKRRLYVAIHIGLTVALALVGGIVYATETINNPEVRARVELMQGLKAQMKLLGETAAGAQPFDADKVSAAIAALQQGADAVAPAFRPKADDPASQALPEIWASPAEFRQKTAKLVKTVAALDGSDQGALAGTLDPVLAACKDCHGRFKMQ